MESSNIDDFAIAQPPFGSQPHPATSLDRASGQLVGAPAGGSGEPTSGVAIVPTEKGGETGAATAEPEGAPKEPMGAQIVAGDAVVGGLGRLSPKPEASGAPQPADRSGQRQADGQLTLAGKSAAIPQLFGESATPAEKDAERQGAKKPVSEKKIEANRRNAQKSPGPTSPEGKQRSSWNSTKHGLLGKRLVTAEGAGAGEWMHLLDNLRADLKPVGALEELLVEKIAKGYWRLQLADAHEVNMGKSLGDFFLSMDKMARYQTAIGRQLARDVADLKRLQRERKASDVPANDAAAEEEGKEG